MAPDLLLVPGIFMENRIIKIIQKKFLTVQIAQFHLNFNL